MREPTSAEQVLEDFLARLARGEDVDAHAFAAQHPELGADLAPALAGAVALHALGRAAREKDREHAVPERVGAFRIVREIGRGGMGLVLEAVEEPLGRTVALKLLTPELLTSGTARARFRREAELAARLDHSGIATVYGAGVADERPWIAMRCVAGETLSRAIARSREAGARCVVLCDRSAGARMAALAVAACLARVARALAFAHERGVVHRDVKPSNVIVTPDGDPVLLDFGLAVADEPGERTTTRTGEMPGTPAYLAPELVCGERARHDAQSDVYALGVTLYECLTLTKPFEGPTPAALYRQILTDAPASVRSLNRDVPPDLDVVVATAIERERGRRYASAAALAEDLEACVAGSPIAARPVPLHGRVARWARREPRQAVLAASLLVATLVAAVLGSRWWTSRDQVHAAELAARDREYEVALQEGFGNLNPAWHERARDSFQKALALRPHEPEALAGLALAEQYASPEAALAVLDEAPATPEFDALRAVARGEAPPVEHDPAWFLRASAIEMFVDGMRLRRELETLPPSARPPLARACATRFEQAILRSPSARFVYHLEWALAVQDTGDEPLMRSAAAALVAQWPNQYQALYQAASLLYRIDPRASIELLRRRIALYPDDATPYSMLADAYYNLGDLDGAQEALSKALELEPRNAWHWNSQFAVFHGRGCMDDARDAVLRAVTLPPTLFVAWANLGMIEAQSGDPARAELALRAALDLDPGENPLRFELVELLARREAWNDALAEAETTLVFEPASPRAWMWVADCEGRVQRPDVALAAASFGLDLSPQGEQLSNLLQIRDEAQRALAAQR